jgi:hypothetical protein
MQGHMPLPQAECWLAIGIRSGAELWAEGWARHQPVSLPDQAAAVPSLEATKSFAESHLLSASALDRNAPLPTVSSRNSE